MNWIRLPVPRSRVRFGLSLLAVVVATATAWYALVEHFSVVDALYETVITISTVGFGEVRPLDTSGRIFTIFLIVTGVGAMLYTVTVFFEEVIEGQLGRIGRRRMQQRIASLSGHVVVCGYGRVGRTVARLISATHGVVVVDNDPDRVQSAADAGFPVVEGDATDDETLEDAGLARAAILIAAVPTDADNLYIVLSGRASRPDMHIVARARSESSESKLFRAGADRVINPQEIGARRMAAFALQPGVSDFLDVVMHGAGSVEYRLEEFAVGEDSGLTGKSIRETHIRDRTGALVLALRGPDNRFFTNPAPEMTLDPGMTVIAIGTGEQLDRLAAYMDDGRDAEQRAADR